MWPLPVVLCIVPYLFFQKWTILCTSFRPDVGQSWAHIGTQMQGMPVLSFLVQWLYQVWDCFGTSLFHFWVSVFLFHFRYRKCTKINPKVVHSLTRKSSTQTWYNPWLILRPKVVHYLPKKMGGLSAARRFFILNKIIYLFPWTLSDSCHRIYDLKFCVPLLDICRHKYRHHNGKDCHAKACTEQTLYILCCQYSHKNHSDRNGYCKKNL